MKQYGVDVMLINMHLKQHCNNNFTMAGCCIPGCANTNEKGYSMRFPTNLRRKIKWIKNINEMWPNWKPPDCGLICHVNI